jgi:hypothetical protein
MAGMAAGDLVSGGDLAGAGVGVSGVLSGSGRHIGIVRGGAGMAITVFLTPMDTLTEKLTGLGQLWVSKKAIREFVHTAE